MADSVIFCGYSKVRYGTKPAGALVVANTFRSMGLSSVMIDHAFSMSWNNLRQLIDKFVTHHTRFICLSTTLLGPPGSVINVMADCDVIFEPIMEYIKQIAPLAVFIVGGSKITRGEPSSLPWNYYVRGQAEESLRAIVAHELRGDNLVELYPNVVSDKTYGFNSFNDNDFLKFTNDDGVLPGETLPIEFGRGCVFKCAFCDYDMIGKQFGDYVKSEEVFYSILMSNYEKFGTTRYQFSDDTLNDSEDKIDRLCRVSKRLPFQLEFGAYLRIELLEKIKDSAHRLLDAGLRGANFGIETLNKTAGATVGKGYGKNAIRTLSQARRVWKDDVAVNINIIVGLPHDTVSDLHKQHEILTDGEFLDHVFYTPLAIPKKGESLFSQGLYKKYYTEAKELHPYFASTIHQYKATETFFNENLNWESPDLNVGEAILLSRKFQDDFSNRRPYVVNNVTAFCVMSLLENFTMAELRTMRINEHDSNLALVAKEKVEKYIQLMLSESVSVPSKFTNLTMEQVVPSSSFVSKINIPIVLRNAG